VRLTRNVQLYQRAVPGQQQHSKRCQGLSQVLERPCTSVSICYRDHLHNHVTLTFDLIFLTGCDGLYSVPTLVLIAQAVFVLQRVYTQTHKDTDAVDHPTHGSTTAAVW